jgi:hypothetical protein
LEVAFKEEGTRYIEWAAKMAVKTDTGVPWIMCKQIRAPGEVVTPPLITLPFVALFMNSFLLSDPHLQREELRRHMARST